MLEMNLYMLKVTLYFILLPRPACAVILLTQPRDWCNGAEPSSKTGIA
jgi:hypothetical protein